MAKLRKIQGRFKSKDLGQINNFLGFKAIVQKHKDLFQEFVLLCMEILLIGTQRNK